MSRALVAALGLLSLLACHMGPRVATFTPARTPEGVRVEASLPSTADKRARMEVEGELLEVREDGLLVLVPRFRDRKDGAMQAGTPVSSSPARVVLIPFDRIVKARFAGLRGCDLDDRTAPTNRVRDRLRLVSRFPQGLDPDLRQRLLEVHGQSEVERLGP